MELYIGDKVKRVFSSDQEGEITRFSIDEYGKVHKYEFTYKNWLGITRKKWLYDFELAKIMTLQESKPNER